MFLNSKKFSNAFNLYDMIDQQKRNTVRFFNIDSYQNLFFKKLWLGTKNI